MALRLTEWHASLAGRRGLTLPTQFVQIPLDLEDVPGLLRFGAAPLLLEPARAEEILNERG